MTYTYTRWSTWEAELYDNNGKLTHKLKFWMDDNSTSDQVKARINRFMEGKTGTLRVTGRDYHSKRKLKL